MNAVLRHVLQKVIGLKDIVLGAYNLRINGENAGFSDSQGVRIVSKKDKQGIDVLVQPGVKGEVVHIPVLISQGGFADRVYNDFYIGENSAVSYTHLSEKDCPWHAVFIATAKSSSWMSR